MSFVVTLVWPSTAFHAFISHDIVFVVESYVKPLFGKLVHVNNVVPL